MADDPRDHVLSTALRLVGEQGLARTSVADVASAAGVSRATLYRWFPGGKDELLQATVEWEIRQFLLRLAEAVAGASDLAELLRLGLRVGRRAVVTHEQLQAILATEPDRLLPLMVNGERQMRVSVADYLVPFVVAEVDADTDPARVRWIADEIARMYTTLIDSPGRFDLDDDDVVARLVDTYLLGWRQPSP